MGAADRRRGAAARPDLQPRFHRRHVRRPGGARLHHPQSARQLRRRARHRRRARGLRSSSWSSRVRSSSATASASSPPKAARGRAPDSRVTAVRTLAQRDGWVRQAIARQERGAGGAGASSAPPTPGCSRRRAPATPHCRPRCASAAPGSTCALFGTAGTPLKLVASADGEERDHAHRGHARAGAEARPRRETCCANSSAASARRRSRSPPWTRADLSDGLFLPLSELNHVRQQAVDELMLRRDWAEQARLAERDAAIDARAGPCRHSGAGCGAGSVVAHRVGLHGGRRAHGAPVPARRRSSSIRFCAIPFRRWRACARLRDELAGRGVALRLRMPTIVRPEERAAARPVARRRTCRS